MDVRLDAGSEVHALDADGFLRRLGLGDALSGDVEGRPVFGRRDGVGHTRTALSLSTRLYDCRKKRPRDGPRRG